VTLAKDTMPIVIGEPSFRRKGIAKAVILSLVNVARTLKWEKITLKEVFRDNQSSQKLYEACGFKKILDTGERLVYEMDI
jgi:ribosomal protein S18 acetylase RimI-like enzyme